MVSDRLLLSVRCISDPIAQGTQSWQYTRPFNGQSKLLGRLAHAWKQAGISRFYALATQSVSLLRLARPAADWLGCVS